MSWMLGEKGAKQRSLGRKEQKEKSGGTVCRSAWKAASIPSQISREEGKRGDRNVFVCGMIFYFHNFIYHIIFYLLIIVLYFIICSYMAFCNLKANPTSLVHLMYFNHQVCILGKSSVNHVGFNRDRAGGGK